MNNHQEKRIKNSIMRSIYRLYAMRVMTHPATTQVGLLGVSVLVLLNLVSVGDVLHNIMTTPVGAVPRFLIMAVQGTDAIVLVLLGLIIFSALSLRFTIKTQGLPMMRIV
jgi:hypothetical protein